MAGPWEEIQHGEEFYTTHSDLIWNQHEEIHNGEESVFLTLKTSYAFLVILYQLKMHGMISYGFLFKADDNSYVKNIPNNSEIETNRNKKRLDYLGTCLETLAAVCYLTIRKGHSGITLLPTSWDHNVSNR